jgi:hypothetical protein
MKYIIFNGPPGSGKDEACHFLKTNYGYKHLQFKDQLFIETAKYYNVSLDWFLDGYDNRTIKETPTNELNGLSRRDALIHVSEDIIKPKFGKDYFGIKTAEVIDGVSSYCFSDGGFVEEVHPLINTVGQENICIVQLIRSGCSFSSDSRNYIYGNLQDRFGLPWHISVTELVQTNPDIPIRMYELYNNTSVSDFHQNIRKILRKEANVNPAKKDKHIS